MRPARRSPCARSWAEPFRRAVLRHWWLKHFGDNLAQMHGEGSRIERCSKTERGVHECANTELHVRSSLPTRLGMRGEKGENNKKKKKQPRLHGSLGRLSFVSYSHASVTV